jgi:hypothetical protein
MTSYSSNLDFHGFTGSKEIPTHGSHLSPLLFLSPPEPRDTMQHRRGSLRQAVHLFLFRLRSPLPP